MKNISLVLNIILLAAVIYLFVEVNKLKKSSASADTTAPVTVSGAPASIVFVNTDSLLQNYEFYKNLKSQLEKKQDNIQSIVENRAKQLEAEVRSYQERGASMSEAERAKEEERLGRKQEEIVSYRKQMLSQLSDEEDVLNDSLHNGILKFLKTFNKNKNYKFILGYQKGGGILLADDSLDITKQVIEGINLKKE